MRINQEFMERYVLVDCGLEYIPNSTEQHDITGLIWNDFIPSYADYPIQLMETFIQQRYPKYSFKEELADYFTRFMDEPEASQARQDIMCDIGRYLN